MSNKITKLVHLLLAGVVAFLPVVTGATAFAAEQYTPVTGTSVSFEKYMVVEEDVTPPNVSLTFSISGVTELPADTDNNKLPVYSGTNAAVTAIDSQSPAVSVGTANFTSASDTYTAAEALDAGVTYSNHQGIVNDTVTLNTNEAYARASVLVDLRNARFNEPGVYRWQITEDENADAAALGVTVDRTPMYLDVYVNNGTTAGTLSLVGYVLHRDAEYQPSSTATPTAPANGKIIGLQNSYATDSLTITNAVTGNQSAIDKYFAYNVTFRNDDAPASGIEIVKVQGNFDGITANSATNTATDPHYKNQDQTASIVIGSNGIGTGTIYLQSGQSMEFVGIPRGTEVTIEENCEEYTPSATADGTFNTNEPEIDTAASNLRTFSVSYESAGDAQINFSNEKTGSIPTGVLMSVLPGAAILALAGGGFVLIARKRKENSDETE